MNPLAWLSGLGGKILAGLALILAAAGFVALRDRRLRREGAEAERRAQQAAAIEHERKTSNQVSNSDEALADPRGPRRQRVRRRFERDGR